MTWAEFYLTKIKQRARCRGRCDYCGRRGPTQSHHLFARRSDHPYLQCDINIAQLCPKCHQHESWEMQLALSVRKLRKHGAEAIEKWAAEAPFKLPIELPPHYWAARSNHASQSLHPRKQVEVAVSKEIERVDDE
jgi:hypothetical protein